MKVIVSLPSDVGTYRRVFTCCSIFLLRERLDLSGQIFIYLGYVSAVGHIYLLDVLKWGKANVIARMVLRRTPDLKSNTFHRSFSDKRAQNPVIDFRGSSACVRAREAQKQRDGESKTDAIT